MLSKEFANILSNYAFIKLDLHLFRLSSGTLDHIKELTSAHWTRVQAR